LTGGDLIATTSVLSQAALAAGATVGTGAGMLVGSGLLASKSLSESTGDRSGAAPGASSAVASVGPAKGNGVGAAVVSPPSAAAAATASSGVAGRTQPGPPSLRPAPSPAMTMSAVGGQPLAGSGFENERTTRGFQSTTHVVSSSEGSASSQQMLFEDSASPAVSGPGPGIADSAPAAPPTLPAAPSARTRWWTGITSTVQKVQHNLSTAAAYVYSMKRRIPSDAAPPATPPRMPIDHED
jgi:hypothetical protein